MGDIIEAVLKLARDLYEAGAMEVVTIQELEEMGEDE